MADAIFENCSNFTKNAVYQLASIERSERQREARVARKQGIHDAQLLPSVAAFRPTALTPQPITGKTSIAIQDAAELRFPSLTPLGKKRLHDSVPPAQPWTVAQSAASVLIKQWGSDESVKCRKKKLSDRHRGRRASPNRAANSPSRAVVEVKGDPSLGTYGGANSSNFHLRHFASRQQERILELERQRTQEDRSRILAQQRKEREELAAAQKAFAQRVAQCERQQNQLRKERDALHRTFEDTLEAGPSLATDVHPAASHPGRAVCFPDGARVRLVSAATAEKLWKTHCSHASTPGSPMRGSFTAMVIAPDWNAIAEVDGTVLETLSRDESETQLLRCEFFDHDDKSVVVTLPAAALVPSWGSNVMTFPAIVSPNGTHLPLMAGEIILETCGDTGAVTIRATYAVSSEVFDDAAVGGNTAPGFADLGVVGATWPTATLVGLYASCDGVISTTVVRGAVAVDAVDRHDQNRQANGARIASQASTGIGAAGASGGATDSAHDSTTRSDAISPQTESLAATSVLSTLAGENVSALLDLSLRAGGNWIDPWDVVPSSTEVIAQAPRRLNNQGTEPFFAALKDVRGQPTTAISPSASANNGEAAPKKNNFLRAARAVMSHRDVSSSNEPSPAAARRPSVTPRGNQALKTVELEMRFALDAFARDSATSSSTTGGATLCAPWFYVPIITVSSPFAPGVKAANAITFRSASVSTLFKAIGPSVNFVTWPATMPVKATMLGTMGGNVPNANVRPHVVVGVQDVVLEPLGLSTLNNPNTPSQTDDVSVAVITEASAAAQRAEVFMILLTPSAAQMAPERCFAQRLSIIIDAAVLTHSAPSVRAHIIRTVTHMLERLDSRDAYCINVIDDARRLGVTMRPPPTRRGGNTAALSAANITSTTSFATDRSVSSTFEGNTSMQSAATGVYKLFPTLVPVRTNPAMSAALGVPEFLEWVAAHWEEEAPSPSTSSMSAKDGGSRGQDLFFTYGLDDGWLELLGAAVTCINGPPGVEDGRSVTPSSVTANTLNARSGVGRGRPTAMAPSTSLYVPEIVTFGASSTLQSNATSVDKLQSIVTNAIVNLPASPAVRMHYVDVQDQTLRSDDVKQVTSAITSTVMRRTRGSYLVVDPADDPTWPLVLNNLAVQTARVAVSDIDVSFPHARQMEVYYGIRDLRCAAPLLLSGRYTQTGVADVAAEAMTISGRQANGKLLKRRQLITKTSLPLTRFLALRRLQHLASERCFALMNQEAKNNFNTAEVSSPLIAGIPSLDRVLDVLRRDREVASSLINEACQFGVPFAMPGSKQDTAVLTLFQLTKVADSAFNPFALPPEKRPLTPLLSSVTPASTPPGQGTTWAEFCADKLRVAAFATGPCHTVLPMNVSTTRRQSAGNTPAWFTCSHRCVADNLRLSRRMVTIKDDEVSERDRVCEAEWKTRVQLEHDFALRAVDIRQSAVSLEYGIVTLVEDQRRAQLALLKAEVAEWETLLQETSILRERMDRVNRFAHEERLRLVYLEDDARAAIVDERRRINLHTYRSITVTQPPAELFDEFADDCLKFAHDLDAMNVLVRALAVWFANSAQAASTFGMHGAAHLCKDLLTSFGTVDARIAESLCHCVASLAALRTNHGSIEGLQLDAPVRSALVSHSDQPDTQVAAMRCLARLCAISHRSRAGLIANDAEGLRAVLASIEHGGTQDDRFFLHQAFKVLVLLSEDAPGAAAILDLDGPQLVATAIFVTASKSNHDIDDAIEGLVGQYLTLVKRCATSRESRGQLVDDAIPLSVIRSALLSNSSSDSVVRKALRCAEKLCGNVGDYSASVLSTHLSGPLRTFVTKFDAQRLDESTLLQAHRLLCRLSLATTAEVPSVDESLSVFYKPREDVTIHSTGGDSRIPVVYGEAATGTVMTHLGPVPFVGRIVRHQSVLSAMQDTANRLSVSDEELLDELVQQATDVYQSLLELHVADVALLCTRGAPSRQLRCLGGAIDTEQKWHVIMFEPPPQPLRACVAAISAGKAAPISVRALASCAAELYRVASHYQSSMRRPHGWLTLDNVFCDGTTTSHWEVVVGPPSPADTAVTARVPTNGVVDAVALHAHACDIASRWTADIDAIHWILECLLTYDPSRIKALTADERKAACAKMPAALGDLIFVEASSPDQIRSIAMGIEQWLHENAELGALLISPQ